MFICYHTRSSLMIDIPPCMFHLQHDISADPHVYFFHRFHICMTFLQHLRSVDAQGYMFHRFHTCMVSLKSRCSKCRHSCLYIAIIAVNIICEQFSPNIFILRTHDNKTKLIFNHTILAPFTSPVTKLDHWFSVPTFFYL